MEPTKQAQYASWLQDLEDQRMSSLTQEEWCQLHNMKLSTFRYRQRAINRMVKKQQELIQTPAVRFAEVPAPLSAPAAEESYPSQVVIELPHAKLTVNGSIPNAQLRILMEAILHAE